MKVVRHDDVRVQDYAGSQVSRPDPFFAHHRADRGLLDRSVYQGREDSVPPPGIERDEIGPGASVSMSAEAV